MKGCTAPSNQLLHSSRASFEASNNELPKGIRLDEHRVRGEQPLEHAEGSLCLRGPYEVRGGGAEPGEGCHYAVVPDKAAVKVGEP